MWGFRCRFDSPGQGDSPLECDKRLADYSQVDALVVWYKSVYFRIWGGEGDRDEERRLLAQECFKRASIAMKVSALDKAKR